MSDPTLPMGCTDADCGGEPEPETCQWCRHIVTDDGCGCGEPGDEI